MEFGDNDVGVREKSKRKKKSWNIVGADKAPHTGREERG